MSAKELDIECGLSICCQAPLKLVRYNKGGFIKKQCSKCHKTETVALMELPDVRCDVCGAEMKAGTDGYSNYVYHCEGCCYQFRVCDRLPWMDAPDSA